MEPVCEKAIADTGAGRGLKAVDGISVKPSERERDKGKHAHLSRPIPSTSQKWIMPSEPAVAHVPCAGWNAMSLIAYRSAESFTAGEESPRWQRNM